MRSWITLFVPLLLVACHKSDTAHETAATDAASSPAPTAPPHSAAAPSAMPSMITPVGAPPRSTAKVADLPSEVTHLSDRIESCDHFAGEEPYDDARAAFLRQQIDATCPGNAAELKRLRQKYAANPAVAKHLAGLEAIEM